MRYTVTVPLVGYATVEVEADDEADAIYEAIEGWDGEHEFLEAVHKVSHASVTAAVAEEQGGGSLDDGED